VLDLPIQCRATSLDGEPHLPGDGLANIHGVARRQRHLGEGCVRRTPRASGDASRRRCGGRATGLGPFTGLLAVTMSSWLHETDRGWTIQGDLFAADRSGRGYGRTGGGHQAGQASRAARSGAAGRVRAEVHLRGQRAPDPVSRARRDGLRKTPLNPRAPRHSRKRLGSAFEDATPVCTTTNARAGAQCATRRWSTPLPACVRLHEVASCAPRTGRTRSEGSSKTRAWCRGPLLEAEPCER
jgi:hypothetical protein